MRHFITYPTNSTYACGANAVGRRNSRLDPDPNETSCRDCMETEAWKDAFAGVSVD